jgi:diguanylate cyclase (GGDEF)-like protein
MIGAEFPEAYRRLLSRSQRRALLDIHRQLQEIDSPRAFLLALVRKVADVIHAKVGVAGKPRGQWVVAAESAPVPVIPLLEQIGPAVFDRLESTTGHWVELWRAESHEWTLVGLADTPSTPVILMLEGDWTACAATLRELARSLSTSRPEAMQAPEPSLHRVTQELTRALADCSGLAAVGELVLRHVVEAVPSRIGSLAVATTEGELSIVATHGYPHDLVEHLRIVPGSGVIGSVYLAKAPLLVADPASAGLDRRRSRYRTSSFVAIPILAGGQPMGVVSLTDRVDGGPYTEKDVAALDELLAPAALALSRERVWREAQAYAQAAVIDPVSGLFNRRYFQARLDEELQRAIRQRTTVGLLMVDLDGFKGVNDRFGHVAGDTVIADISEILRRSVRIFDVCTRFGGEEFAVMMPGGTVESAAATAERIRQRIEAYQRSEWDLSSLTASIGVAAAPPGVTSRDLIERADRALYHAKTTGKNRVSAASADGTISAA